MQKNQFAIPAAIIIAAGLLAGAIYFSGQKAAPSLNNQTGESGTGTETPIPEVSNEDHILGNPNAKVMIVEYSDYDCPFCKSFHETMHRIIDEYGASGDVAWVYRHFPLQQLHPNAPTIALASECVAELGGNDAFWTFSDLVFDERETNAQTDISRLPEFATAAGVDATQMQACIDSGRHKEKVEKQFADAIAAGGTGTPFPVVIVGNQQGTIEGAQPYPVVKQMIDTLLTQIQNEE